VQPGGHSLRDRLADWLEPQGDYLAASRPELPDELDDRAQDVWEPLLAIADLAGGDWPQRATAAALALSSGDEREDDSVTALLVRDIATAFEAKDVEHLKTADLLEGLHEIEESPWGDWYGKPLSAHGLSRLLKPYRVKTMPVWSDGKTVRGYKADQFSDAFTQLGIPALGSVRPLGAASGLDSALTLTNALTLRPNRVLGAEASSHAAPNVPNASNASPAGDGSNGRRPGDAGYLEHLYAAFEAEHVTEREWNQLSRLHRRLAEAVA
jgi:Protein of unknown function (DUF3631)